MTLIKSISGIRGTIGGKIGENLTPLDIVGFTMAYSEMIKSQHGNRVKVVVGRDGRISGPALANLVITTLSMCGLDVIDAGLSTTPTIEMAVIQKECQGGIILTASHNGRNWNALKLLNHKGEFISASEGQWIIDKVNSGRLEASVDVESLGNVSSHPSAMEEHIDAIIKLPVLNVSAIRKKNFKMVVDAVNSTGALIFPILADKLNIELTIINEEVSGDFAHDPEPLPKNLLGLCDLMKQGNYDIGVAVDPDVDRLAFVGPNGDFFGEEYTLVAASDFILSTTKGNTVSNLSSTLALRELTRVKGGQHFFSAVGEVNVVEKMKLTNAVIGGEGNGGVIYPELHYGRDALVGTVFVLNLLCNLDINLTQLKSRYPIYEMVKDKIGLSQGLNLDNILLEIKDSFPDNEMDTIDGLKIYFENEWVHLRKSNTEPIIRIYAESKDAERALSLSNQFKELIQSKANLK